MPKSSDPAQKKKKSPSTSATRGAPAKKAAAIEVKTASWWDDFYRVVRQIPRGRITTYGVVAELGGHPRAARHVGFAMAALEDTKKHRDVPWQRVLGAAPGRRAQITIRDPLGGAVQRAILEKEGIAFDERGRIDLATFGWPEATPTRKGAGTAATREAVILLRSATAGSRSRSRSRS
ncbi:MAG: MGMT family protein [Byssovorax sp.]